MESVGFRCVGFETEIRLDGNTAWAFHLGPSMACTRGGSGPAALTAWERELTEGDGRLR